MNIQGRLIRVGTLAEDSAQELIGVCCAVVECTEEELKAVPTLPMYRRVELTPMNTNDMSVTRDNDPIPPEYAGLADGLGQFPNGEPKAKPAKYDPGLTDDMVRMVSHYRAADIRCQLVACDFERARLATELAELNAKNKKWRQEVHRLTEENARLAAENESLRRLLAAARHAIVRLSPGQNLGWPPDISPNLLANISAAIDAARAPTSARPGP